ncbi:MAG: hypothetical protein ACTSPE_11385 [Candidatus Thorarchaeota archaeon]
MKSLTIAKVSQLRGGHINLHGLEEVLGVPDGGQVLLVGTSSKFIRVIPVSGSAVLMLRVAFRLSDFAVSARQVLKVLKGMGVSMIHSTGFCPMDEYCLWEGFFESDFETQISQFVEWLKSHDAVLDVELERLEP